MVVVMFDEIVCNSVLILTLTINATFSITIECILDNGFTLGNSPNTNWFEMVIALLAH